MIECENECENAKWTHTYTLYLFQSPYLPYAPYKPYDVMLECENA